VYHYAESEEQKPTFISAKEKAIQPKKAETSAEKGEEQAFEGQKEAK